MLSWTLELLLETIPVWAWAMGIWVSLTIYILSSVLAHIPEIETWGKLIKPVSGITLLWCVFMYGGTGVQKMWEEKIKLAEEEVDKKTAMSQQLTDDLDQERKRKAQIRIEYKDRIKTEIQIHKELIDKDCRIDPTVPEILNKAASNPEKAK
jgi:hypothetical protein